MDKEQLENLQDYLNKTKTRRYKMVSLLNDIDEKIDTLSTILRENCPHETKTREYDECDQRNYYRCDVCGLL